MEPVTQTVILGKTICVKPSVLTFSTLARPSDTDEQICAKDKVFCENKDVRSGDLCPPGTRLCGGPSLQARTCVPFDVKCPITELQFLTDSSSLPAHYETLRFNDQLTLAYTREASRLPISDFRIAF